MCGIAGFVHKNLCDDACIKIEAKIQELQECRGPDAHSTWSESKNGVTYHLYHQRLRIQDLSAAADQPMHSTENPKTHIVFNGEIYNIDEMRATFLSTTDLHTHSDTEILLESLVNVSPRDVLPRIRGMFAFGLLNTSDNSLYLARDRFGEKPLHFWRDESRIIFASQYDSIVDSMKILNKPIEFDQESIYEYLIYGYFPYHTSLVKGVEKLAPNSSIHIHLNENYTTPNQELWSAKWQTNTSVEMPFETLEKELEEAIKIQLIGDVPIGVFLSGGCDSTLVSAIAQKLNSKPIHSFSLGFENESYDESRFASQAAKEIGTHHHALKMTAEDALEILPIVLKSYPEPLGDPSVLPTTFISRETRKYVTVALTGDGADELFFGYGRYARFIELKKLNEKVRSQKLFLEILDKSLRFFPKKIRGKATRVTNALKSNDPSAIYASLVGFAHINAVKSAEAFEGVVTHSLKRLWKKGTSQNEINRLREIDADSYLTDDILVKVDRAAMAFALETRAPFLDPKIARIAAESSKNWLNGGEQKHVIKVILENYVSDEIYRRSKMGFGAPLGDWFRTVYYDWASNVIDNFDWKSIEIDSDKVNYYWKSIQNGDDIYVTYLWMLLILANSIENLK